MVAPSRSHTVLVPPLRLSCGMSESVQHGGNLVVTMTNCHPANDLYGLHGRRRLSRGARPLHRELSVCTPLPVNCELKGLFIRIRAHDNLLHGRAKDHLLDRRRTAIAVPAFRKVLPHQSNSSFLIAS